MHGPVPQCGAFLNAAPREQAVVPCCGPVWADLVKSFDLVLLPACTNAVHSHLFQVYCWYKSVLMFLFEGVTGEILVYFYFNF